MVASTFAGMAIDCIEQGQSGLMMAITDGCYAAVADPRSEARPAQGGRRDHVQHRALPPDLRQQTGPADLPDARVIRDAGRRLCRGAAGPPYGLPQETRPAHSTIVTRRQFHASRPPMNWRRLFRNPPTPLDPRAPGRDPALLRRRLARRRALSLPPSIRASITSS